MRIKSQVTDLCKILVLNFKLQKGYFSFMNDGCSELFYKKIIINKNQTVDMIIRQIIQIQDLFGN
ncbi:hypothetical protein pb186bvf_001443 [Paramecium bursaria]